MFTRPLLYCGPLAPMVFAVGVLAEGAHHMRGRTGWSSWRPHSLAAGLTVAVTCAVTVMLAAGLGWCALLAGRLPETTGPRPLSHAPAGGQA